MKRQNPLKEEVLSKNWQTLFVVGVVSFLVILAIDFAADDEGVTPREDLPPAFEHHGQGALPVLDDGGAQVRLILGGAEAVKPRTREI